jgi:hypothetical protein
MELSFSQLTVDSFSKEEGSWATEVVVDVVVDVTDGLFVRVRLVEEDRS